MHDKDVLIAVVHDWNSLAWRCIGVGEDVSRKCSDDVFLNKI